MVVTCPAEVLDELWSNGRLKHFQRFIIRQTKSSATAFALVPKRRSDPGKGYKGYILIERKLNARNFLRYNYGPGFELPVSRDDALQVLFDLARKVSEECKLDYQPRVFAI